MLKMLKFDKRKKKSLIIDFKWHAKFSYSKTIQIFDTPYKNSCHHWGRIWSGLLGVSSYWCHWWMVWQPGTANDVFDVLIVPHRFNCMAEVVNETPPPLDFLTLLRHRKLLLVWKRTWTPHTRLSVATLEPCIQTVKKPLGHQGVNHAGGMDAYQMVFFLHEFRYCCRLRNFVWGHGRLETLRG